MATLPETTSQLSLSNLSDSRLSDNRYLDAIKDIISNLLLGKSYAELPGEYQLIGNQILKILVNSVGDKFGIENRGAAISALQQGIVSSGSLPLMTLNGDSMGAAYGHGAVSLAIANQLEGVLYNFYNDKDGKINYDNVGTLTYSMIAEAGAQIAREQGFNEGSIITHQYEKGSQGISKGIQELKSKGIADDNKALQDAYLGFALTQQYEEKEKEYEELLDGDNVILDNGKAISSEEWNAQIEELETKLKDESLSENARANIQNRLQVLNKATAPHTYRAIIKELKNKKDRTEEETRQLQEAEQLYAQSKYDFVHDNMLNKQIDVYDDQGNLIEANHVVSKGDMRVAQLGVTGRMSGTYQTKQAQEEITSALKAARSNIEILKQTFNTEDFHKLQEIAKELGMGSLTKKENVAKVRDNINNAVALARMSGRDLKEIFIEQGDIRENLSKVLGTAAEYINADLVAGVQEQYAQHVENYRKGYTKIDPAQAQATFLEQRGNAFNVDKYELLASAIAEGEEYKYITENSPEAKAQLDEIRQLYEQANNATNWDEHDALRSTADAMMQSFANSWMPHMSQEQQLAIAKSKQDQAHMNARANYVVAANARDALTLMGENSSLANAANDMGLGDNWKETFVTDIQSVNAIFGTNIDLFNEFKEKAQTDEGYAEYKQNVDNLLTKTGRSKQEREQIISQLDTLRDRVGNDTWMRYIIDMLLGTKITSRGSLNDANREYTSLQAELERISEGDNIQLAPMEVVREAVVGGRVPSDGAAVLAMFENDKTYKDQQFVHTSEAGNIVVDTDKINSDIEEAKGLAYIDIKNLDSVRNNEKALKLLGLDQLSPDEITEKVLINALSRFKNEEGGSVITTGDNSTWKLLADKNRVVEARKFADKVRAEMSETELQNRRTANTTMENSYIKYAPLIPTMVENSAFAKNPNGSESNLAIAVKNLGNFKKALFDKNSGLDSILNMVSKGNVDTKNAITEQIKAAIAIVEKYDNEDGIGQNETDNYSLKDFHKRLYQLMQKGRLTDDEISALQGVSPDAQVNASEDQSNLLDDFVSIGKAVKDGGIRALKNVFKGSKNDEKNDITPKLTTTLDKVANLDSSILKVEQATKTAATESADSINKELGGKMEAIEKQMDTVAAELKDLNKLFNSITTGNALNAKFVFA